MKKQLITLLMAGLLVAGFGGSALAAGTTEDGTPITGAIDTSTAGTQSMATTFSMPETWTITIPKTIAIGDVKPGEPINESIPIKTKIFLEPKRTLTISVGAETIELKNVKNEEKKITGTFTTSQQGLTAQNLLSFTDADNNYDIESTNNAVTLTGTTDKTNSAGNYTATAMFTVTPVTVS